MKRPLKDKVEQVASSDKFTRLNIRGADKKEVIGISGTPFPNYDKENLMVIYVLSGDPIYQSSQFARDVKRKINGRPEYDGYKVDFLKSGTSSKKNFKEQAVVVTIPGEDIAITRSDLDIFEGIIERQYDDIVESDVEIKEVIYEMEGKP
jgi:hypothetical protein